MKNCKVSELKKTIVNTAAKAGEGHIPSSLSVVDILWVLYDRVLMHDPANPCHPDRDRFILSKGHASLGLYAVLAEKGYFPLSDLESFGKFHSYLGGHADRNKVPGVEASTGSLGHGFPISVGIALGLQILKKNCRVFTLIGDGECNEGTIWESALLAAHHNLSNLCCIVDFNHSTDRALRLGDLAAKFDAFGWKSSVINGHDQEEIYKALSETHISCPRVVIARTIKGCGCRSMENNPAWHHKSPSAEELKTILEELS
jgi:transketolase